MAGCVEMTCIDDLVVFFTRALGSYTRHSCTYCLRDRLCHGFMDDLLHLVLRGSLCFLCLCLCLSRYLYRLLCSCLPIQSSSSSWLPVDCSSWPLSPSIFPSSLETNLKVTWKSKVSDSWSFNTYLVRHVNYKSPENQQKINNEMKGGLTAREEYPQCHPNS